MGSSDTLLLMGCRTVDLLSRINGRGTTLTIVSLWDVEDRDCGPLGDALVAAMSIGLSPSDALRSVQALRSHRPPFEWAGYAAVDLHSLQPLRSVKPELVER